MFDPAQTGKSWRAVISGDSLLIADHSIAEVSTLSRSNVDVKFQAASALVHHNAGPEQPCDAGRFARDPVLWYGIR